MSKKILKKAKANVYMFIHPPTKFVLQFQEIPSGHRFLKVIDIDYFVSKRTQLTRFIM